MKSNLRFLAVWALIIATILMILGRPSGTNVADQDPVQTIPTPQFMKYVDQKLVESVTFRGDTEVYGVLKETTDNIKKFRTTKDPRATDSLWRELREKGLTANIETEQRASWLQTAFITWVPVLAIIFIFFLFMRQLQSGSNKALSFGQSRARMFNENQSKVKFNDVAGCDEAKNELEEIVDFLKSPKKFTRLGGRIPKGVLLIGPPGTGKTLLAKAIAGEASVPFFSISGSDFVEMFVGVGASRVRSLFENAKRAAPCLIFIDEIDAVGRHRGAGMGGGHDEREQTLNQLLVEMDGFEGTEGVIIIAATNRSDVLDPALLRPGRFDRRVTVSKPDLNGRTAILKVHTRKTPLGGDIDLSVIARGTPGFAGADLENLVNEAALNAARLDHDFVTMTDFEYARDKVSMGPARKSMIIPEEERRHTAYHEAGHAIVGRMVAGNDPVHKVTIIPRGQALGLTLSLPIEDSFSFSKSKAQALLAMMMGGRVAEELTFGHLTTGASNDIERATEIARKMVTEWGMSEKLGPVNFSTRSENIFVGRDMSQSSGFSEETGRLIDAEIRAILELSHATARKVLTDNKAKLELMADTLLDRETIDAAEVDAIIDGRPLPERKVIELTGKKKAAAEKEGEAKGPASTVIDLSKPAKA
jgi:cell division protease FtsH